MAVTKRQRQSIDFDWRFHLGDAPRAEQPDAADSDWRLLDLPHDWGVEGEYGQHWGTDWQSGFLPAGVGWYRRPLDWDPGWQGRRVAVEFDGVYMNSDVWINGHHLGHRPYGYSSFAYDLSPHLKPGRNVLAVRVDHSKPKSGRWYTGSGIYRHVWLRVTHPVHVAHWGTWLTTPEVSREAATVNLKTEVANTSGATREVTLGTEIRDPGGKLVTSASASQAIRAGASADFSQTLDVPQPNLWSPEDPQLYTAHSQVLVGGETADDYETTFGIRKIEFGAAWGFKLNGEVTKLKGVCNHHDAGPVGAAVPDDVLERRLRVLKEMGCNAIRTAHNPFAPEFYDLCDRLGFLVMNEAFDGWETPKAADDYGNYFSQWWQRDLTDFLKRDRNHPSVALWSIGNEVRKPSRATQKKLVDTCHRLDPTRPVTQGGHDPTRGMRGDNLPTQLDVKGFNGDGEEKHVLERYHADHPNVPMVGTEIPHTYQTRGVYRTKTNWRRRDFPAPWEIGQPWSKFAHRVFPIPDLTDTEVFTEYDGLKLYYQSSYDNASVRSSLRKAWQRTRDFDFMAGQFRWTGFDYLGETNKWPSRFANFGVIDICGFPKDAFHLLRSLWTTDPMVHILPHWTHPGKEGVKIPVVAYTNADSVELFLNGESLGEQAYEDEQLVWHVPYQPGVVKAVARQGGAEVATAEYRTAGEPAAVKVTTDRQSIRPNRRDVVHLDVDVVDPQGVMVPHADHLVRFVVTGPARLIGVDNGDPLDLGPYKVNSRQAFHGKCLAILQAAAEPGEIEIRVESDGLAPETLRITAG